MERLVVATRHDDAVALRFNEVVAMVRKPGALFDPRFMYRVVRSSTTSAQPASQPAAVVT